MSSKEKNVLNNLEKNNSIGLKNFLMSYCGICTNTLLDNKITHKDIKVLFPYLKRVDFEYVLKNIKEVYVGNIILVKDSYGHIAPYLNPKLKEINVVNYTCTNNIELNKEDIFEKVIDLEHLNTYQLIQLSKKYKSENRINEYRKVCRIIKKHNRDSGIEQYHEKKEKILMKGRLENDEY